MEADTIQVDYQTIRFYFQDAGKCVGAIVRLSATGKRVFASYDVWNGVKCYYVEVLNDGMDGDAV